MRGQEESGVATLVFFSSTLILQNASPKAPPWPSPPSACLEEAPDWSYVSVSNDKCPTHVPRSKLLLPLNRPKHSPQVVAANLLGKSLDQAESQSQVNLLGRQLRKIRMGNKIRICYAFLHFLLMVTLGHLPIIPTQFHYFLLSFPILPVFLPSPPLCLLCSLALWRRNTELATGSLDANLIDSATQ